MSKDWVKDISLMHNQFRVYDALSKMDNSMLRRFLEFRLGCLEEELQETQEAFVEADPEEIVDGIIDLIVFAIGTLDVMGVDAHQAWDKVLKANMSKRVGVKASRPNPFGLPDLVKPDGWMPPSHKGNHGKLDEVLKGNA